MSLLVWLDENKQWVLSGVGVAIVAAFGKWVFSRASGNKSSATAEFVRRFVFLPPRKLFLPAKDSAGLRESRMRYYRVQFIYRNGDRPVAYQEVDSNGNVKRYVRSDGRVFIPDEPHEASIIGSGEFQFPSFARIDWADVFGGNSGSGRWGMRS